MRSVPARSSNGSRTSPRRSRWDARPPTDRDDAASCPGAPPASRCEFSAGRCHARSAVRNPSPELQGRHRSRKQAAKRPRPPLPKPASGSSSNNFHPLPAVLVEGPLDYGIEHEIHDVVAERAADEKLDRDIVDPLRILARIGLIRAQPALRKNVSHRAGGGFVAFSRIGGLGLDDIVELQVPLIERVRRAGEARRADAVLSQELVGVE